MAFSSHVVLILLALSLSLVTASPSAKWSTKAQRMQSAPGWYDSRRKIPQDDNSQAGSVAGTTRRTTRRGQAVGSSLGTLQAPELPQWMNGPTSDGKPWGARTAKGTNAYDDYPDTGVTRYYTWEISNQTLSPDGIVTPGIVVNGQFPGPTIEANWGDWVEVKVTNNLGGEGTTLHWHGLLQKSTPWMDGVPAIDQCPIPPTQGKNTFTYRFRAELYGTSWWHSHYSAQYSAGVAGPIVVYGPTNVDYDMDLGPVMMTDWYHEAYYGLVQQSLAENNAGNLPVSNNNLINGRNNYACDGTNPSCIRISGLSQFRFHSGKSMRLRLINHGAQAGQKFSIDNHNFTVIANDFVPIEPYITDNIILGVGQRADIIVNGTGKATDAVWMRALACGFTDTKSPLALATVLYENAPHNAVPNTTTNGGNTCPPVNSNPGGETPYYPMAPGDPSVTLTISINQRSNGTNQLYYLNNSSYKGNYNAPTLLSANAGHYNFTPSTNLYNTGSNSSVRIIWYNYKTSSGGPHPMHLHGHNIFVLATGVGTWDGTIQGDSSNPTRRDVALMPPAQDENTPSFLVTQWTQDNPGVWPFHCHVAWHISAGFLIQILERPDDVKKLDIPGAFDQTCKDWDEWTKTNAPGEIDSGL
jgi:FtsP/CotA-like multicopper oxidase with cupredoxin domain